MPAAALLIKDVLEAVAGTRPTEKRVQALKSLEALAKNDQDRSSIIASGGARTLVTLLAGNAGEVSPHERIRIANILADLATTGSCRTVIVNAGAVLPLIKLLAGQLESGQEAAASALAALSPCGRVRAEMVEEGVLNILKDMLESQSPEGQKLKPRAAETLAATVAGEPEERLERVLAAIDAGVLPVLVQIIGLGGSRSPDAEDARIQAAVALGALACDNATRKAVIAADALPPLVALLTSGSDPEKGKAARALSELATKNSMDEGLPVNKEVLLESAFLPPLVKMLKSASDEIRSEAVHAIYVLAMRSDMQEELISAGVLPGIIAQLKDGNSANFYKNSSCRQEQGRQDGKSAQTKAWAVTTLRGLATSPESREAIERAVPLGVAGRETLVKSIQNYCF